jgi:hypothetical protein
MTLRLRRDTNAALDRVAAELRLDRSATLRFLVHEKERSLGLKPPPTNGESAANPGHDASS